MGDLPDLPTRDQLEVRRLGDARVPSPYQGRRERFIDDEGRVLVTAETGELEALLEADAAIPSFEAAGPRREVFHSPDQLTCGIVTCGGLCPGVNDVIRSIVLTLNHGYGVRRVLGFHYGYAGLSAHARKPPTFLEPAALENAHLHGGTLLGTSRGPQSVAEMVDNLVRWKVSILFTVGGDGTLRGASAIAAEIEQRGLPIGVIGVPKTIDNDLLWIERSFGFATAVEAARAAIGAAHTEARSAWNGIGLVKLMGRHSGFIAAHATLASGDANFCLVPEVPFALEGDNGFLRHLEERVVTRRHAAVVVAEGAGQDLVPASGERDASGNLKLGDIGGFLKTRIREHFAANEIPIDLKYIDPSYMIRSQPANTMDSSFCLILGQHAAHAGMAGRTDMMVGFWNHSFTHVPLSLVAAGRKQLDPEDEIWQRVLDATGQPPRMR
ncbi:MAG: ATP-dependent 6-phosphofructokinase [Thermoanaerobaculia bacterium]|nr:ATP-dependent 6-phosphofructokinase [Thermoanaerobaculia bacterium]